MRHPEGGTRGGEFSAVEVVNRGCNRFEVKKAGQPNGEKRSQLQP